MEVELWICCLAVRNMDVDQHEEAAPTSPAVPEKVQEIAKDELKRTKQPMQKVEIQSLNTRAYLDHTVVPILMDAMTAVAKDRSDRATVNQTNCSLLYIIFLLSFQTC